MVTVRCYMMTDRQGWTDTSRTGEKWMDGKRLTKLEKEMQLCFILAWHRKQQIMGSFLFPLIVNNECFLGCELGGGAS